MKRRFERGLRTTLWLIAFAIAVVSSVASEPGLSGWETFRGDPALTGVAEGALPDDLEALWVFDAGDAIESGAAIHDGTVYAGALNGFLYALDLATGKEKWKFEAGAEIRSSPSHHDGLVYFGDGDGVFHAVDAKTGKQKWTFQTDAEIVSSANFAGDRVLFGSHDSFIYCLSAKTGELIWKVETENYVYGTPAITDGTVISAGCDGYMRVVRDRKSVV